MAYTDAIRAVQEASERDAVLDARARSIRGGTSASLVRDRPVVCVSERERETETE